MTNGCHQHLTTGFGVPFDIAMAIFAMVSSYLVSIHQGLAHVMCVVFRISHWISRQVCSALFSCDYIISLGPFTRSN